MADDNPIKHEPPRTTEQVIEGKTPPSPPAHPNPAVLEDAGSRALSDALRSSFIIVKFVMVILVLVFFASGIFTVPSQERAMILRFGKPVGLGEDQILGPGLHWSFPYPIDEVVRLPIGEVQTVTSTAGWYQTTPEAEASGMEPPPGGTLNPAVDGYTLTADGNIVHVRATIRYRITDPVKYVFNFVNASNVVKNIVDSSLFYASAMYPVDAAVRGGADFKETILKRVRDEVHERDLGIAIEDGDLRTIPPRQVAQAFLRVSEVEQERRKARDEAQSYANRILSTAEGEAAAIVNRGKTEATQLLQRVAAEANYFKDQLPYYEENPQLFRSRLRAEAMGRILTNAQDNVFFVDPKKESQLRLQLNKAPRRRSGTNTVDQAQR